jgi:hypothetical protein
VNIKGSPPRYLLVVLGLATLLVVQGTAFADIQVGGNTTGSAFFQGSSSQGTSVNNGWAGLSFTSSTFGPQSSSTPLNLGSFSLGCFVCAGNFTPYDFDLLVDFTVPVGTSSSAVINGDVKGKLSGSFLGTSNTVGIGFTGLSHFTYSNGQGSGSFDLAVNSIAAESIPVNGGSRTVTGNISNISNTTFTASTPEPASIALLGTLMIGLGIYRRKRSA